MRTKENKKGISLIVLIITIIVVIILAVVVILTLSKNKPIESAKEAQFKEDVRGFQDELAMYISKDYTRLGGQRDYKISTSNFNEIKEYIPSFSEKYKGKFIIQEDELKYADVTEIEKNWCENICVNEKNVLYTELEYLESAGVQWIDTDYSLNINTKIESKFYFTQSASYFQTPYGLMGKSNYLGLYTIAYVYTCFGNMKDVMLWGASLFDSPKQFVHSKDGVWVNGNKLVSYTNTSVSEESTNIIIFARSELDGSISRNAYMKLYYFKIYDNDRLIKDFIPVLDKKNKPALYDKVEGKFYYNQGTGEDFKYKLKE